jgi:hypothetical protein
MAMEPDQCIAEPAEERIELQTIGTGITPKAAQLDIALGHVERRLASRRNDGLSADARHPPGLLPPGPRDRPP